MKKIDPGYFKKIWCPLGDRYIFLSNEQCLLKIIGKIQVQHSQKMTAWEAAKTSYMQS